MRVDIHTGLKAGVTEVLHHDPRVHSLGDQEGCTRVGPRQFARRIVHVNIGIDL